MRQQLHALVLPPLVTCTSSSLRWLSEPDGSSASGGSMRGHRAIATDAGANEEISGTYMAPALFRGYRVRWSTSSWRPS